MSCLDYTDSINVIKGIGDKTEKAFARLGIFTVRDLLEHYPRRYETFDKPIAISRIEEGLVTSIEASILSAPKVKRVRNLQITNVQVRDNTGIINLTWFNMPFLLNTLRMGSHYIFRGKVIRKNNAYVLEQPQIYSKENYYKLLHVLQPVYSLTNGITNKVISKAIKELHKNLDFAGDFVPRHIIKENNLIDRVKALKEIHFPSNYENMSKARERLVFDEFFLYTMELRRLKDNKNIMNPQYVLKDSKACDKLIGQFPYPLTNAQKRVWEEIKRDMISNITMNRLVQGDVGSGKTVLAILALLLAAENSCQSCFMVPTEVLAGQHYKTLTDTLASFNVAVCLLVGSMTIKEKREAYEKIKNHQVDIIVGTHALIQEKVEYDRLGLVITDEQHRFGVKQREALMSKAGRPHVLVMSATPIPRTLAMILYGDLDISIVDELPAKRLPIKNCVVNTDYRPSAYRFIDNQISQGRQAYVICPMVDESEVMEAENVIEYVDRLREGLSPGVTVEYLHGRMKPKEKNQVMERFARGELQVLVSTTVVEVGVDVPNATVMMVENAEHFGLAQLHQLRGRVGRGIHQSYCIFICSSSSKEARERLEILNKSNDGFYIAGEDLKLRGQGDLFGIRQSGSMEFKLGDVFNDSVILKKASDAVKALQDSEILRIYEACPYLEGVLAEQNIHTL